MAKLKLSIQENIEIPSREAIVDRVPWEKIKVGASFPVSGETFGENPVERLRTAISYRQKATKEKYSVRKTEDGYRCWRVA